MTTATSQYQSAADIRRDILATTHSRLLIAVEALDTAKDRHERGQITGAAYARAHAEYREACARYEQVRS
jgi:hypothetical protein